VAKDIQIGAKTSQPTQAELLARVTGPNSPANILIGTKTKPKVLQMPPPAGSLRGGSGSPPLPQGRPVTMLTEMEKGVLKTVGWDESQPVPANMADIIAEAREQALGEAVDLPLPVSPDALPVQPTKTVQLSSLPPEQQKAIQAKIQAALAAEEAARKQASTEASLSTVHPSIQQAHDFAARQSFATPGAGAQFAAPEIVDDRVAPATPPVAAAATPPAAAATEHVASDTGAVAHPTHCPHCLWQLSMPDIPEPEHTIKMGFLQSMLGGIPFVKTAPLFGGVVEVAFRTLTTKELEIIHTQAFRDRDQGRMANDFDFWEKVNRYRLYLQLVHLKSNTFQHVMPEGFSEETSGHAQSFWKLEDQPPQGETALPQIEDWMMTHVLKTEALFRVVNNECARFNRLVSKLEAVVDNSDFWKPTAPQS